jgi:hypothetical protein
MEQSPSWEADSFSASQEIPRHLCNPKDHYHILKSLPLNPNLEPDESNSRLHTLFI